MLWLLALSAATALTVLGQHQERDRQFERFATRAETGASFVGAYVDDVFKTEARLGAEVSTDSWQPAGFVSSSALLGSRSVCCSTSRAGWSRWPRVPQSGKGPI